MPTTVKFDGNNTAPATEATPPSPGDPTRTSQPDPSSPAVPAGKTFDVTPQVSNPERYHILGEHGRGGLGRVSRAHDHQLGRDIAIKELISRGHISEVRFLREALITARLEHPGIVPVYEAGRWPDGTPFYAMKLVAGRSLHQLIAERTTVDERIALLHHVIAVADALAYAHGRNIIHRDLKPANVIVGDFGETIVIDWGLAKDLTAAEEPAAGGGPFRANRDDGLTSAGSVLGTPAYMAPEQERGEPVDQRADVYAIGTMLWELCSLQKLPPSFANQRHRILRRAGIDQDLITIIDKACDPDPARRYPDAGALATDLKAFKAGARIASRRYSLWALLSHWTRRHRTLTVSLVGAITIATAVGMLYVRNIASERDRAAAARHEAELERSAAAAERDRAQLSEAAMWLEKDPTHARELLQLIASPDPQRALLLAEAEVRSASRVLHVSSRVQGMQAAGQPLEVAIVTINGELVHLDIDTGTLRVTEHDLTGPLTNHNGHWCYARGVTETDDAAVLGCGSPLPLAKLLQRPSGKLSWAKQAMYALDAGELYRLDSTHPIRVAQHIRGFAGSDVLSLMCTEDGRLQITRNGSIAVSTTCASNESKFSLIVKGEHYVALRSSTQLISDRGTISLPDAVKGEYVLALGDDSSVAFGDLSGDAWMIPPGHLRAERIAQRAAHPRSVAASGSLVASGYSDGAIVVVDAISHHRWEFIGHQAPVWSLVIDAAHRRLISSADDEIRIWELHSTNMQIETELPCEPFHIVPTNDGTSFAMDCSDGHALVWTPDNHQVRALHQHRDLAFGVTMHHGEVCTGGWDGRVLCTSIGGGDTKEVLVGPERVKALARCAGHLFVAIADGTVWQADREVRLLYKHRDMPFRIDVNSDCTRLASGAYDGTLIIYNLGEGHIDTQLSRTHDGQITGTIFQNDDLVTSSIDAHVKRWRSRSSQPARDEWDLVEDSRPSGPVSKLHVFNNGWAASISERTFMMHFGDARPEIRLTLGQPIADIAISPDDRYVAAAALTELVIVDTKRNAIAVTHAPGADVTCLQFVTATRLVGCDRSSIISLALDSLEFRPMTSTAKDEP